MDKRSGERRFVLENGAKLDVRARLIDQWLELSASATACPLPLTRAWSMLRHNATLSGTVRVALAVDADEACVWGEAYVEDEGGVAIDARIASLCDEAQSVFHALHGADTPGAGLPSNGSQGTEALGEKQRLVQLCTEAGWPLVERGPGWLDVPLECGPAQYQAQLAFTADGRLSGVVELLDASALTPASRAAIALLLLKASTVVRGVKGVIVQRDGADHVGLAAACERPRSSADIDRALTALTVACGLASREAHVLRHDTLAREYLAWQAPALLDESSATFDNDHATR